MEPRGDKRTDILFAKLSADIANMVRGKDTTPFSVEDFMLKFDAGLDEEELEEPSELDLELMQRMIASPKERRSG
jgi:hypothetical protein